MQGHPLGRKFKALICHDGSFSTANHWSTEELFFPIRDFGGTLWERRDMYDKWDPSRFTDQWATPMLVSPPHSPWSAWSGELAADVECNQVIHNELDYRLPVSEGLAMFNVLQARGIPSRFVMFPDENHVSTAPTDPCQERNGSRGTLTRRKHSGRSSQRTRSSGTARSSSLSTSTAAWTAAALAAIRISTH